MVYLIGYISVIINITQVQSCQRLKSSDKSIFFSFNPRRLDSGKLLLKCWAPHTLTRLSFLFLPLGSAFHYARTGVNRLSSLSLTLLSLPLSVLMFSSLSFRVPSSSAHCHLLSPSLPFCLLNPSRFLLLSIVTLSLSFCLLFPYLFLSYSAYCL